MKTIIKSKALGLLLIFLVGCTTGYTQDTTVYVTKTGAKYHRESCQYLRYSKTALALDSAQLKGYTACKVCKPLMTAKSVEPEKSSVSPQTTIPTQSGSFSEISWRCRATTQKGTRCKRTTTNSSHKCRQHE